MIRDSRTRGGKVIRQLQRSVGLLLVVAFGVIGVSYAFLLPPFQVPDERRHWVASHYYLSKFISGSGTVCSTDIALDRHFQLGIQFDPEAKIPSGTFSRVADLVPACEETRQYGLSNVTSYPGVLLSRLFVPREPTSGEEALAGFYLSRLLHGTLIGLLLLRLWWLAGNTATGPPGLLAIFMLSLSPLFVQQSVGVTNDVVSNAFSLALCTWLVFSDRVNRLDETLLVVLGGIAAFTKPVLSVPLLPVIALGLTLESVRRTPQQPWLRSLTQAIVRKRVLVGALVAVAAAGLVFARLHIRLGRRGEQVEFMTEHPWHVVDVILAKAAQLVTHPSVFLDYLGYLDLRIGAASLASFGLLAGLIAALEAIGFFRACRGVATDPARVKALMPALGPVSALASLVVSGLAVGFFTIGYRAYLMGPFASDGLDGMQPRYLFPHLLVGIGVATAIARTFLDPGAGPVASKNAPGGRNGRILRFGLLGVFALALLSFAVHLATAVLARYY